MATQPQRTMPGPISPETLITIKIDVNNQLKKLKLPLRDLGANVLPDKLRNVLAIRPEQHVLLERYSDSAAGYITLDTNNPQVFKTLIRAAKAKLKLRLKATVTPIEVLHSVQKEKSVTKPASITLGPVTAPASNQSVDFLLRGSSGLQRSTLDQRSQGTGIFQFREAQQARNSQALQISVDAPVLNKASLDKLNESGNRAADSVQPILAFRPREPAPSTTFPAHAWSVFCNECDKAMDNEHFHCSICDGGDYDLCQDCVSSGKSCPGDDHWLIKRFIQNGKVTNSTTERLQPRKASFAPVATVPEIEIPGCSTDETKTLAEEVYTPTRTCNNCIVVLPEHRFVTCMACDDFDLCMRCHSMDRHGHNPAHGFKPAADGQALTLEAQAKLAPGRNVRHNAICDGCERTIYGVRHKCLNCPDWDYCNDCIAKASSTHPRHRFAAFYQPLAPQNASNVFHFSIYCDGPLCANKPHKSYIQGVRYKCTICHNKDFCEACEALEDNHHNRTHPLIKFKTYVRHVNVSTENEDASGSVRIMGDRCSRSDANSATQVQTVADFQPTEIKKEEAQPAEIPAQNAPGSTLTTPTTMLNALFVRDSIADGTVVEPQTSFTQVWTLTNPGPLTWPAGCSIRFVGGDSMLNVDNMHPVSGFSLAEATESNVIGREVQAGEEVAFRITLKAPVREGKSISYWRLKTADGTPFGHRLWCDIEVKKADASVARPTVADLRAEQQTILNEIRKASRQHAQIVPAIPVPRDLSEQPPSYDSVDLAKRLDYMRQQQKSFREQIMSQLGAQHGLSSNGIPPSFPIPDPKEVESLSQEERTEVLLRRMDLAKANIIRAREERVKMNEVNAAQPSASVSNVESVGAHSSVERAVKDDEDEEQSHDSGLERSQMVFPKLDKESPASSTYQSVTSTKGKAAYVENEEGDIEHTAAPATTTSMSGDEFVDLDDDELEVLSATADESDDDDGFLTDEEYDVLDASDQETVVSRA